MTRERVVIAGMGVVRPLGSGIAETRSAIAEGLGGIRLLGLFQTPGNIPHPVGLVVLQ
jgi:3-oxoacyl-(acyl-carrier-protein) synthase